MVLTKEDLIEIRTLMSIGWKPKQILDHRVANKYRGAREWKRRTIYRACKKIEASRGSVERKNGSGRPRSSRTEENEDRVEELLLSPDRNPGTHLSHKKAARVVGMFRIILPNLVYIGISRWSVGRIAKSRGIKSRKKVRVHKIPKPSYGSKQTRNGESGAQKIYWKCATRPKKT